MTEFSVHCSYIVLSRAEELEPGEAECFGQGWGAGAARKKNRSRSRSRLEKKSGGGAGAAKKFAGSPDLYLGHYATG